MSELLEVRTGPLVTLTMNRPDSLNALSSGLIGGMIEAFDRLGRDVDVGAILLTGAGRSFCVGGDVKAMAGRKDRSYEERVQDLRWKQRIAVVMHACPKIIVAAVNGPAMGAGLSLALAADFRIVGRSAEFATAFASVGLSGDFGANWSLTRLLGPAKAREMMILNPRLMAEEADRLGLVTRLVDDDALMAEATAFATGIAEGPRITYGYIKRNLFAAETESLGDLLEIEATSQSRCAMTEDHKEALRAWAGKRPPVFTGR